MKKSLLFLFSGLVILASSCQRKEFASFKKSDVVSYAQPKKTQATPVQEVTVAPTTTEATTASIVETQNVASTSVLAKAVAENNVSANTTVAKANYSFKGVTVNSKAEFMALNSSKIKAATGTALTFKEKFVLKAVQKQVAKGKAPVEGDKSWVAALLICFFVGVFGIHRFYLGYTWQGVVQLLTFGGLGLWAFIDLIRIIIKDLEPKDGSYN